MVGQEIWSDAVIPDHSMIVEVDQQGWIKVSSVGVKAEGITLAQLERAVEYALHASTEILRAAVTVAILRREECVNG
jgi:hypothetical protein